MPSAHDSRRSPTSAARAAAAAKRVKPGQRATPASQPSCPVSPRKRAAPENANRPLLAAAEQLLLTGACEWDLTTNRLVCSEGWRAIHGCSSRSLTPKQWLRMAHPEDRPALKQAMQQVRTGAPRYSLEHRIIRSDTGEERIVRAAGELVRDERGRPVRVIGVTQDITGQKRAEEVLRHSERKCRRLHETMTDAFVSVDMRGRILETNAAFQSMLGYSEAELRRLTYMELTPRRWHAFERRIVQEQILRKGHSEVYAKEYRRKDGTLFPVELRTVLMLDDAGKPAAMWAIVRDITARKQAEETLQQSEARLRLALDASNAGTWSWEVPTNRAAWDERYHALYGFASSEPVSYEAWLGRVHPEDRKRLQSQIRALLERGGDNAWNEEFRALHPVRGERWMAGLGRVERDAKGRAVRLSGINLDITERKQAEAALRLSEQRAQAVLDASTESIVLLDRQGIILAANATMARRVGRPVGELLGKDIFRLLPPGLARTRKARFREVLRTGQPIRFNDERTGIQFDLHYHPIREVGGEVTGVAVFAQDITQRRQAEELLRRSEAELRGIAQNIPGMVFQFYARKRGGMGLHYVSDRALDYLGLDHQQLDGFFERFVAGVAPEDRARFLASIREAVKSVSPWEFEGKYLKPDGEEMYFRGASQPRQLQQELVFDGIILDVTERKQAEAAMHENEERLRLALAAAKQGLFDLNLQTGQALVSPEYAHMLGYEPNEMNVNAAWWQQHLHPEEREVSMRTLKECISGQRNEYRLEYRLRCKGGDWKWILSLGRVVACDPQGKPSRMLGTHTDMTELKQAGEDLRASGRQATALLHAITEPLLLMDPDGIILALNAAMARRLKLEPGAAQGRNVHDLLPADVARRRKARADEVIQSGQPVRFEDENAGAILVLHVYPALDAAGKVVALAVFALDITERRRAEEALRASDAALQELNRRLQVANAELEQRVAARTAQLRALAAQLTHAEERERRRAAHVLHEGLQQLLVAAGFSLTSLEQQTEDARFRRELRRISDVLQEAMEMGRTLTYELSPPVLYESGLPAALAWLGRWCREKFALSVTVAASAGAEGETEEVRIALFHAVRELLFNAVKHAQVKRARIQLDRLPDGTLRLVVRDQGIGFDPVAARAREGANGGFGLFSVRERLERLGGHLDIASVPGRGSRFILTIPAVPPPLASPHRAAGV